MRFLVFIICIVILVAIFSTQNSQPVSFSFLLWKFQASLAIVIFLSMLSGIVLGVLASFFIRLSKKRKGLPAGKTGPATAATTPGDNLR